MEENTDTITHINIENVEEGWLVEITMKENCDHRHVFTEEPVLIKFLKDMIGEPTRVIIGE